MSRKEEEKRGRERREEGQKKEGEPENVCLVSAFLVTGKGTKDQTVF